MAEYDKVFKKHLKEDFLKMVANILSIQFDRIDVQEKPTELTSKILRSDFVFEVVRKGREEIWHIEEQTATDTDMFERMLLYVAFLYKKYKKPVYQVVLYVGDSKNPKSQMKKKDRIGFFEYSYEIINLSDIPYKRFLKSANMLPFAVLGKYDSQDSEKVLEEIFQKANKLLRTDIDKLNFVTDLVVLSKKRSLSIDFIKSLIKKYMATIDYKNTFIYEEGKKEGKLEGKKEGKLEGKLETAKALIILGDLSLEKIAQVTGLTLKQIKDLEQEIKKKKK